MYVKVIFKSRVFKLNGKTIEHEALDFLTI
jgi:hypothetical protein